MKKMILLLLIVSFFIVSCGQTSERGTDINYKQGFTDITIASEGNKEEYQGQPLQLPISAHNTLAYDLEDVSVSIKGFDNHFVEMYTEQQQLALLEGKSVFNHEGMKEHFLFEGLIKKLLPGAEKEQEDYRVYVYYKSKVEFSPSICVASQPAGPGYVGAAYDTYQGGCTFQKEISYTGQGAPLGVTGLEIISRPGKQVELRMKIEKRGKGKVGKVTLASAALGGKPLTCEFRGDTVQDGYSFEEEQKSVILICAGYLSSDAAYTTPLFVELRYDYEINQKETLTIFE
ncbi:MAG: hypothetical protein Q8R47_01580 [Nanoarchaeota archaeon]|nr:hypothetical protein [Nanoarchaeota archaeon]